MSVQHSAELRDGAGAVRQGIVAAVVPGRALEDLPRQGARLRMTRRKAHQARQRGETGRGDQVMLKNEPPSQLLPRVRVGTVLDPFQELRNTIHLEPVVTRLRPVHHSGVEPSPGARRRAGLAAR
ncbi:hypothetical protein ADL06_28170 [Streptomyces sp. NRRL F-6491]|nr:hypothetical protein ADL06_28170 [Streptomyces sp. NRRL F-6491]KOX37959.1 hypothetical protein ADL08_28185 [Streptomyces sp. NRRL F-6492]